MIVIKISILYNVLERRQRASDCKHNFGRELKMKNNINKVIMAKLESRLYNEYSNSVLRRGNSSVRVDMLKNSRSAQETASRKNSAKAPRNQVPGTPLHQA